MGHDPEPALQRAMAGEPADPDDLPPPTPRFLKHLADSADTPPGVEADIASFRVMNGDVLPFDEPAARAMLERCWARATDPSAAAHHGLIGRKKGPDLLTPLSTITAPTAIVHGDQDPIFTLAHGEALAAAIPDAHLHIVEGMGHVYFSPRPSGAARRPDLRGQPLTLAVLRRPRSWLIGCCAGTRRAGRCRTRSRR
jgi:pimeloyl-ACP methyl ester carboxylesterase